MTEQELIAEAKARANIATQKMNEQFHNTSSTSKKNSKRSLRRQPNTFLDALLGKRKIRPPSRMQ